MTSASPFRMARLVLKLVLVALNFWKLDGSMRSLKSVYKPIGPKMCAELGNDLREIVTFVEKDLSCRPVTSTDCKREAMVIGSRNSEQLPGGHSSVTPSKDAHPSKLLKTDAIRTRDRKSVQYIPNITLHQACEEGKLCVVQYVLSKRLAGINCRGKMGRTPVKAVHPFQTDGSYMKTNILHLACKGGNVALVEYILSLNANGMEDRDKFGRTSVMIAARRGFVKVVKCLVKNGCNLRAVDNSRNNILHVACDRGHVDMVKYLITLKDVDRNGRNKHDLTPRNLAMDRGYENIVDLLNAK